MRELRPESAEMSPQALSLVDKSVLLDAWVPDNLLSLGLRGRFAATRVHQGPACLFPHENNFPILINSHPHKPTQPDEASGIRPKEGLVGGENPSCSSPLSGQFYVPLVLSLSLGRLPQAQELDRQTWVLVWTRLPTGCVTLGKLLSLSEVKRSWWKVVR